MMARMVCDADYGVALVSWVKEARGRGAGFYSDLKLKRREKKVEGGEESRLMQNESTYLVIINKVCRQSS